MLYIWETNLNSIGHWIGRQVGQNHWNNSHDKIQMFGNQWCQTYAHMYALNDITDQELRRLRKLRVDEDAPQQLKKTDLKKFYQYSKRAVDWLYEKLKQMKRIGIRPYGVKKKHKPRQKLFEAAWTGIKVLKRNWAATFNMVYWEDPDASFQ